MKKTEQYQFPIPMSRYVAEAAIDHAVASKNHRRVQNKIGHFQAEIELLRLHQAKMTDPADIARCNNTIRYWNTLLIETTEQS